MDLSSYLIFGCSTTSIVGTCWSSYYWRKKYLINSAVESGVEKLKKGLKIQQLQYGTLEKILSPVYMLAEKKFKDGKFDDIIAKRISTT